MTNSYLRIRSRGEAELGALTLLGASSKRNATDKIGFFGSGMKYAICTLLAAGNKFSIFFGTTPVSITTRSEVFRNEEFHRVVINNVDTSLTTTAGPQWTEIDAFRELYSNALDEGLIDIITVPAPAGGEPGTTTIYIEITPTIASMRENIEHYFLNFNSPSVLFTNRVGSLLSSPAGRVFRRGIWAVDENIDSAYGWDFTDLTINESRKASTWQVEYQACKLLSLIPTTNVLLSILSKTHQFDLNVLHNSFSNSWSCAAALREQFDFVSSRPDAIRPEHRARALFVSSTNMPIIERVLPSYQEWLQSKGLNQITPTQEFLTKLSNSKKLLSRLGVHTDVPVRFVATDANVYAFVKNSIIHFTDTAFSLTEREVCKTFLEELIHVNSDCADFSRPFQEALLEITMTALEKLD